MTGAVLVTGGAGYIGSHAVIELLANGYRPVVLDDFSTGRMSNLPGDITTYRGDIADGTLVRDILKRHQVSDVIHFAGSIVVPESITDPIAYYRNNTAKALELIAQCVGNGVKRFVFSSTAAVYGVPEAPGPVKETVRLCPISPYGTSKLMVERMLTDICVAHPAFRAVSLRYFNVAGADPLGRCGQAESASTNLITAAVETALGRRPHLTIFGDDYATRDGACERDFIHVSDLASLHLRALAYLEDGGQPIAINCGYGRGITVLEVVQALERLIGRPLPTQRGPRRPGDAPSVVADVSTMRTLFDWKPRHDDLETILRTAMEWRRSQLNRTAAEHEASA